MTAFLYYALKEAEGVDFHGIATPVIRDFPEPIGFNSVVALEDLPAGTQVTREDREGFEVNVVSGIERTLTNRLIIILANWERSDYGVHTIYPGEKPAPLFCDTEFWDEHAFIV